MEQSEKGLVFCAFVATRDRLGEVSARQDVRWKRGQGGRWKGKAANSTGKLPLARPRLSTIACTLTRIKGRIVGKLLAINCLQRFLLEVRQFLWRHQNA